MVLAYLLPDPAAPVSIPSIPEFFQSRKMLLLRRLVNDPAKRKMDSGLKMLIEPILYCLVASTAKNIVNEILSNPWVFTISYGF